MIIEIRGVSFRGLGAELMIRAITDRIGRNASTAQFAVEPVGRFAERSSHGLLTKAPRPRIGRSTLASALMTESFRRAYGIVKESEIEVVLDASGFAYSDFWSAANATSLRRSLRRWRASLPGKRVVLLPQAFGPFDTWTSEDREIFREALSLVDLAFVRDAASMRYLREIGADRSCPTYVAPDFTLQVEGRVPGRFQRRSSYACIAPNVRMLDKTSEKVASGYVPFLDRVIRKIQAKGLDPILLTHPGSGDEDIARQVSRRFGGRIERVNSREIGEVKGILSGATVVVGSRYHYLITALSQGVPAVGVGWSHKYDELFAEYGCEEFLLDDQDDDEALTRLLDLTMDSDQRNGLVTKLKKAAVEHLSRSEQMWSRLGRTLQLSGC